MPRFSNDTPVFGVHFTFPVLAGRELYHQPLMANDNQPELISFTHFKQIDEKRFDPNSDKNLESYFLLDQHGYTYHNQYPGVRQDIDEKEGNYRFNLGVEYPWYQRYIKKLIGNIQYEYIDLNYFLLKCAKGFKDLDAVLNDVTIPLDKRSKAASKGKALHELYTRVNAEFKANYPGWTITPMYSDAGAVIEFAFELSKEV